MIAVSDRIDDLGPSPKMISRSWLAPILALALAGTGIGTLKQFGADWNYLAGTAFVCGFLGGWMWQWLNPRDFVDRFGGWATLLGFACLLMFVPGVSLDSGAVGAFAWLGIPVGVVWRESDRRRRGVAAVDSAVRRTGSDPARLERWPETLGSRDPRDVR